MRLSLDALRVIDAIDRGGSFARAADLLHRVPSAITYTVRKLEQDLDVALFDRSGHRAELTPAGRKLLEDGRRLLESAATLEDQVRRVATGWEAELRIAVDELLDPKALFPLIEAFHAHQPATRLRIQREVLGGTWDALVARRADLILGASGEGPAGKGYASRPLGSARFVFAVAPDHPLARAPSPLSDAVIARHRAVAVGDTSRQLPPRTSSLLAGQDVLTVPDMAAKIEAQRRAMGVGYVPEHWIAPLVGRGELVVRETARGVADPRLTAAWHADDVGLALRFFVDALADDELCRALLAPPTHLQNH